VKFKTGTEIIKKGTFSDEVFFIMQGVVLSQISGRRFTTGAMIGISEVALKIRSRQDTFKCVTNTFMLKYKKKDFLDIMSKHK